MRLNVWWVGLCHYSIDKKGERMKYISHSFVRPRIISLWFGVFAGWDEQWNRLDPYRFFAIQVCIFKVLFELVILMKERK
jgi:hypothetical protein